MVELQGLCTYEQTLLSAPGLLKPGCAAYPRTPFQFTESAVQWSPDGSMIAAVGGNGQVGGSNLVVWDAHHGHVLYTSPYAEVYRVIFTPDSKGLVVSIDNGIVRTLSTATWTVVNYGLHAAESGLGNLGFIGFTPDGSTILAIAEPVEEAKIGGLVRTGSATLIWLDAATLKKITMEVPHPQTGSPKSTALSPDGSLMAIGASDGILRIWDTKTGALSQQMAFGGREVQGVAFIDDAHLAVTPQGQVWGHDLCGLGSGAVSTRGRAP